MTRQRPDPIPDRLDKASTELLQLLPRLSDALAKDYAPAGGKRTASAEPSMPVNPDVVDAMTALHYDIPEADDRARACLGESSFFRRDLPTCVTAARALYQRLTANHPTEARRYADAVFTWHRTARKALGLTQPATDLGRTCPLHDDPATPLLVRGAEATLRPGRRQAITWQRGEAIWCPHCRGEWGKIEFAMLGRLIDERDQRMAEQRMTELTEFLLARIAEDEETARAATESGRGDWQAIVDGPAPRVHVGDKDAPGWQRLVDGGIWQCQDELDGCPEIASYWIAEAKHIAHWDPARVLAECEAKRRIVRAHEKWCHNKHNTVDLEMDYDASYWWTMMVLAAPYADHPDYRAEEWAP